MDQLGLIFSMFQWYESYCWWFRNPVNSPVDMVVYPIFLQQFINPQVVFSPDFWTIGPVSLRFPDLFFLFFFSVRRRPEMTKCCSGSKAICPTEIPKIRGENPPKRRRGNFLFEVVVEPTHLKNMSQNGFIFPKFRGENVQKYLNPPPSIDGC